ncbi:hypothetical protein HMPREF1485_00260 [Propionibacterium sp. HGH0353]|uniref:restriction endonuclease subunit S n=2 Tax=Cutibacterium avidum TaxID=33010 RepID=UPI000353E5AC|nr:restriction endonuclease subunit S [Cutibacterium avidum]EPH06557.1 hypothetical protein HMPREF1485_00260 [Propionibacterium sp. HGH0353]MCO6674546.1 restriction endonuclease subunit S [Cutibacterium avidum]MCO6676902.1 restriction endonuclease subunit S [Cutibacterium avidum]MDU1537806.1 restriction endonuclease subunit S [Cutibacterium avidum]
MSRKLSMRDIVVHAVGGGWGFDAPADSTDQVAVIRGADFPAVSVGDISGVPIRWEERRKLPSRTLQPLDIILEISGGTTDRPTGRTVFISDKLLASFDHAVIPASFYRLVRVDTSKADPYYVYWWLQGMYAEGRTWAYQNRSTGIANFQFEHFLDTEHVFLPPIEEQRAIAATLGALDDKIESNRRATAVGESLIRALVESALDASEGADGTLGDYCSLVKAPVKVEDISAEDNYIGLEHMPRGSIFLTEWEKAQGLGSNKTAFQRGDVLFGKLRPYFKKVGIAPVDGVCSTDILAVRPKDPRDIALIAVVAASDALIDSLSAGSTGTRMPRASWKDLAAWQVPILTSTERAELSARVAPLVDRLEQLTFESRRLTALRDALLPELLSGRIRVPAEGVAA